MDKLTIKCHIGPVSLSSIPSITLNIIQILSAIVLLGLIGGNYHATSGDHSAAVRQPFPT